jgi:hypothetical protein
MFLNTQNFKGPVAFFTPFFWSRASVDDPRLAGMFLDSRPSGPNRALQMEIQVCLPKIPSLLICKDLRTIANSYFVTRNNTVIRKSWRT